MLDCIWNSWDLTLFAQSWLLNRTCSVKEVRESSSASTWPTVWTPSLQITACRPPRCTTCSIGTPLGRGPPRGPTPPTNEKYFQYSSVDTRVRMWELIRTPETGYACILLASGGYYAYQAFWTIVICRYCHLHCLHAPSWSQFAMRSCFWTMYITLWPEWRLESHMQILNQSLSFYNKINISMGILNCVYLYFIT